MKISLNSAGLKDWNGSVLIFGIFSKELEEQLSKIDLPDKSYLIKRLKEQNFKAKSGEISSFDLLGRTPYKLILVGLGESKSLLIDDLRKAAAIGARASLGINGKLGVILPWNQFDHEVVANAVGEAIRLSIYKLPYERSEDSRVST